MAIRIIPPEEAKKKARANLAAWKRKKELARMKGTADTQQEDKPAPSKMAPRNQRLPYKGMLREKRPNLMIWRAIQHDDLQGVKDAIAAGADISGKDKSRNPLVSAAGTGKSTRVLEYLISIGMDVNGRRKGTTPLISASVKGKYLNAKILLEEGADVNLAAMVGTYYDGSTPLICAAEGGHESVVRLLIEGGADVDLRNDGGDTALILASKRGHMEAARALLEAGADVNVRNKKGQTALAAASGYEPHKRAKLIEMLRKHGAEY